MLALFCLRLAFGMLGCLLLLPPALVNPRFYRTHFLTALGLGCLALFSLRETADGLVLTLLGVGLGLAFLGSLSWSLEGAPGGQALILLTVAALAGGLAWLEVGAAGSRTVGLVLLGDLTSSALLGTALTAMLMGHSYLIAPSMSLTPLLRLLVAVAVAVAVRAAVDGFALWRWTGHHPAANLGNDVLLWLPVRWGVGFVGPLALTWMAWQAARIRSTQSATGILYVVVLFSFLGELTGQLLRDMTGITL